MNATNRMGLALALCSVAATARAERPPDDRAKAPVVFVGRVETIDERWDLESDYYRVTVRAETVERGRSVLPGALVVVACDRWSRPWPGKVGGAGHTAIPDAGDRIRVYALPGQSDYVGCYPDWYDAIEPTPDAWVARHLGYRKFRAVCWMAAAVLSGFAVWRFRRRRRPSPAIVALTVG